MSTGIVGCAGGRIAIALLLVMALSLTAAAKSSTPPDISELNGTVWMLKISGTGYYLPTGDTEKIKGVVMIQLTWVDPDILRIDSDEPRFDDTYAYYSDGLLIVGDMNDEELSTDSLAGFAVISGNAGKMKMKGQFGAFDTLSDDEAAVVKVSGKQVQDF